MVTIVNLRAARKAAARNWKRQRGDENAARFGRDTPQRQIDETENDRARRHIHQHRITPDKDGS